MSEIFGIDLGMGAIKLYNEKGNVEFLSQVSACTKRNIVGMGGLRTMNSCVLIELPSGKNYFSGPGAHSKATIIENFSLNRFSGSIDMRVLTYGVFSKFIDKFEAMDIPIILVVGLPIETLIGGEFKRTVNDLKSWLIGNHSWKANGKDYHILVKEIFTTSQPAGAFFDYVLDLSGKIIPERQIAYTREVGILSLGMNTVEMLVIRNKSIVERLTSGSTSGVRKLLELVNLNDLYSTGELDDLLRSNGLDISQTLPIWEREVIGFIEKTWGKSWRRFSCILIVGGGAILLKNTLPHYFQGKSFIPDDPVMSIARGLYKLGMYQDKSKNV